MEVRTYESAMGFLDVEPKVEAECVITDVRMPELSGVDLLRRLRELKLGIPVIVITGHGDVPLVVEAMKIGAQQGLRRIVAIGLDHPVTSGTCTEHQVCAGPLANCGNTIVLSE
jgi:DNA-binding NarL/FixJ family response regulator